MIDLDASDEVAHLALMQRHAASGDRHAALRQFEQWARTRPGRLWLPAVKRRLSATGSLPNTTLCRGDGALIGRDLGALHRRASSARYRRRSQPHPVPEQPRRSRQVGVAHRADCRANELGFRIGHGTCASWRTWAARRWSRRSPTCVAVTRPCSTACGITTVKRSTAPSPGGAVVDGRELAPAAVRRRRGVGPSRIGHPRPAHHRRRPRRRRREPAAHALHRVRLRINASASCSRTAPLRSATRWRRPARA